MPEQRGSDWARIERALKRQEIAEEAAHVGTFEADLATAEITISREIARLHQVDPSRLVLSVPEFFAAIHPEDRDRLLGLVGERGDFTVDYRYGCLKGDGARILEISGRWLPGDTEGHPGYFIGVERDVTEQRAQEAQLRQLALRDPLTGALNRRGFEQLLERHAAEHPLDDAGCLLMIDLDDFKHHNDTYGHAVGDQILVAIANALQERLAAEDAAGRIGGDEFVVLLPGRTTPEAGVVADDLLAVIADAAGRVSPDAEHPVTASIGVAALTDDEDPTLVLRRADEAMYAAKIVGGGRTVRWSKHPPSEGTQGRDAMTTDATTGLPNRQAMLRLMDKRLGLVEEIAVTGPMVTYLVTIYGLELLDAQTAHTAYRVLLRTLTERFTEIDDGGVIGMSGVAQIAALVEVRDEAERDAIATRVQGWLHEPFALEELAATVMPLVATATWSTGIDAFTLLQNATIATNVARYEGPGTIRHYDAALRAWAMERATTHVALRRGIARDEFRLVYQPVLDLHTGRFERAEALVRWQPSSGTAMGPDRFIPVAEATGLILPLGERIVDMAIAQAYAWREQGRHVRISVNLSAVELTTPGFAEGLLARLEASGLATRWFTFEVTESALMDNITVARAGIQRIHEAGYRVVLDDFGTGHSSLARLSDIATSGLKIDMSLVRRLTTDPATRTVVAAIVDVAGAYGISVTAEGIEDAETLSVVRALGVDFAQGYYLSRPRPAVDLVDVFAATWPEGDQAAIR